MMAEYNGDFQKAYEMAMLVLSHFDGRIELSNQKYVEWVYIEGNIRVVFYPYRVKSTCWRHIRVRQDGGWTKRGKQIHAELLHAASKTWQFRARNRSSHDGLPKPSIDKPKNWASDLVGWEPFYRVA